MSEPTKHVRFIRNVSHGGLEYGPSYPRRDLVLPDYVANTYIERGVCVEVRGEGQARPPTLPDVPVVQAGKKTADPPKVRTRRTRKRADG